MRKAWDEVARLVLMNAKNARKPFTLRTLTDTAQQDHMAKKFAELMEAPGDLHEMADVFACLMHWALRKGWTLEAIEEAILYKLRRRFMPVSGPAHAETLKFQAEQINPPTYSDPDRGPALYQICGNHSCNNPGGKH